MKAKEIIIILICLGLLCLSFGFSPMPYASPDSDEGMEANVITESDAGGGKVSGGEILLISFLAGAICALVWLLFVAMIEGKV